MNLILVRTRGSGCCRCQINLPVGKVDCERRRSEGNDSLRVIKEGYRVRKKRKYFMIFKSRLIDHLIISINNH